MEQVESTEPITYEKMYGNWYLIDRGPVIDSSITACEKREYVTFRTDTTCMRHQDCLPKTENEGTWRVENGKCYMRMYLVFNGMIVSDSTDDIEFKMIAPDKIKVEKQYPLFLVWGIYQKQTQ
jgi:hypothetical protein